MWPATELPLHAMQIHAELQLEVPVDHGLLVENLLDLAHAPFTHTTTFAKGWPVPDVVKFQAQQLLAGHWEPYPIDMSFEPPCMVLSTIGALIVPLQTRRVLPALKLRCSLPLRCCRSTARRRPHSAIVGDRSPSTQADSMQGAPEYFCALPSWGRRAVHRDPPPRLSHKALN